MRIGQGYDVHRLEAGRKMVLGGVDIPCGFGPVGHSDADVLLHAVMDSVLGALALGDIGQHFPDSDLRYKGISSMELLKCVAAMMNRAGMKIDNLDSTVVLQSPKIQKYVPQMRENIASALGAPAERVSVKATTEEGMGFTGRGEGVAAHAVVLLHRR